MINRGRTFCVASNKKCIGWIHYNTIRVCPVIDFLQRSIVFLNDCSPNFDYLLKYINACTDTEHQRNHYPAARKSASPPETFTQQLNMPGTATILQGANWLRACRSSQYAHYWSRVIGCEL